MVKTVITHSSIVDLLSKVEQYKDGLIAISHDFSEELLKKGIDHSTLDGYSIGADFDDLGKHKYLLDDYIKEIEELKSLFGIEVFPLNEKPVVSSSSLRRVVFSKYIHAVVGGKDGHTETGIEGVFHRWGVDYEEFEEGPGNYSIGIIEMADGRIENVASEFIKFVDPITV